MAKYGPEKPPYLDAFHAVTNTNSYSPLGKRRKCVHLINFWRTQQEKAVCFVYTICRARYLRGRFRSLPSN